MKEISGVHMVMDGYVSDASRLEPDNIVDLFDALVWTLDMQYLQRPTAIRVKLDPAKLETTDDDGGWSVIAQITTSHIALHGWPLHCAFCMDIFSCHPFDTEKAKLQIWRFLDVTQACEQVIERKGPLQGPDLVET